MCHGLIDEANNVGDSDAPLARIHRPSSTVGLSPNQFIRWIASPCHSRGRAVHEHNPCCTCINLLAQLNDSFAIPTIVLSSQQQQRLIQFPHRTLEKSHSTASWPFLPPGLLTLWMARETSGLPCRSIHHFQKPVPEARR